MREAIERGEYAAGQMIPSERELCDLTHLSRTTVRRGVQLLVEEGVLQRVPGAGTFVGHSMARGSCCGTVGLIVPTLTNPYFGELSDAVEQEAHARGFDLLVGQSEYVGSNESAYLQRYADNLSCKGMLVVPNVDRPQVGAYNYVAEHGKPVVFVARWTESVDADAVAVDGFRGSRDIVRYLISLGHRRIAYVQGGPRQPDVRLRGYQEALREAGIAEDPRLILLQETTSEQAGLEAIRSLLQSGATFTAVFARRDLDAMSVLQGLAEAGLRVPEDVSVAGFDNIQIAAHLQPPLTTVDHTVREIARLAVNFLLERVEGRYCGPPRRVSIQPRLVIRASCAAPA